MSKGRSLWKSRWLGALMFSMVLIIGLFSFWQPAHGTSLLYGKIADTRDWIDGLGSHVPSPLANAKVMINSKPRQTTYTDTQGQFWFKDLRDISYAIEVEVPYEKGRTYNFTTKVNAVTGEFFDLIQDQEHNLEEIDY
jgi:hypothetical protein